MKLVDLWNKSMLILGFHNEGESTYKFLRSLFPGHIIGIADERLFEQLSPESQEILPSDMYLRLHLGSEYLSTLIQYDVIIKEPQIDLTQSEIEHVLSVGRMITSHTDIFLSNCPSIIVGITGTDSTREPSRLIHNLLVSANIESYLVGGVFSPSLPLLKQASTNTVFIYEMSAQVLNDLRQGPHIAIVLSPSQDSYDHVEELNIYIEANQNISAYQSWNDYFIYDPLDHASKWMARKTKAKRIPYSSEVQLDEGCFISNGQIVYRSKEKQDLLMGLDEIQLRGSGKSNLNDLLHPIIVGKILGIESHLIAEIINNIVSTNR